MKFCSIISDGTPNGTKICLPDGRTIPGVISADVHFRVDERATMELTMYVEEVKVLAELIEVNNEKVQ